MSLIVVTAAEDEFVERVTKAVEDLPTIVRSVGSIADAKTLDSVARQSPAVIVIGQELDGDAAFDLAESIDKDHPAISVIVVAESSAEVWRKAVQAGVRGVIDPDEEDERLRVTIKDGIDAWQRHRARIPVEPQGSRIITVISPKGGVGKTVLSTNLAVGLASRYHRSVALLDLDLRFGDAAYALMLAPQHTMKDAVAALPDLTATRLKVFLTAHSSGVFTLCAPDEPAEGDAISAQDTGAIIELTASLFSHVVIDTGAGLDEHTLAAIEQSTDVIIVSDMDVPSVRNVRKALDTFDLLGMTNHRRHFVLNRADSRVGLKRDDVRTAAAMPIDLEIPSSRYVPLSVNEGRPLITTNPRSSVSRRLWTLVEELSSAVEGRIERHEEDASNEAE